MLAVFGRCESCAREDERVAQVRRVYLVVVSDESEDVTISEEAELWCAVCREHYPHQPI